VRSDLATLLTLLLMAIAAARPRGDRAATPPPGSDPVLMAERALGRAVMAKGARQAFLEFLGDGAIVFRPGPVLAKRWYLEHAESAGERDREPERAELAESGDLGYATGPWELRADSASAPSAFGHYVRVWTRTTRGELKVVLDAGVAHPRPDPAEAAAPHPATRAGAAAVKPRAAGRDAEPAAAPPPARGTTRMMMALDLAYARECAKQGRTEAFTARADDSVRVYREGTPPLVGREVAATLLPDTLRLKTWEPVGGGASDDGRLGFTYGIGRFAPRGWTDTRADSGAYVRIWRRAADREWKLILDCTVPLPHSAAS
jgi:ketosteroid isomerase-like protein